MCPGVKAPCPGGAIKKLNMSRGFNIRQHHFILLVQGFTVKSIFIQLGGKKPLCPGASRTNISLVPWTNHFCEILSSIGGVQI